MRCTRVKCGDGWLADISAGTPTRKSAVINSNLVTGSSLSVVAVQFERWMLPSPFDCFSLRLPQLFRSQFLFQSFLFLLSFLQVGRRCQVYELIGSGLILLDALSLPVHLSKPQQGKSVP